MSLRTKNTVFLQIKNTGLLADALPNCQVRELLGNSYNSSPNIGFELSPMFTPDLCTILPECAMHLNIRPPSCPY